VCPLPALRRPYASQGFLGRSKHAQFSSWSIPILWTWASSVVPLNLFSFKYAKFIARSECAKYQTTSAQPRKIRFKMQNSDHFRVWSIIVLQTEQQIEAPNCQNQSSNTLTAAELDESTQKLKCYDTFQSSKRSKQTLNTLETRQYF
jgi:hypothetical protein